MEENKKRIILGCGSGRCGSVTLSRLLSKVTGVEITHEKEPRLPWVFDENRFVQHREHFSNYHKDTVGNIALDYLNYLERYFAIFSELKVIVLKRNKKDTVESFIRKSKNDNWWTKHNGTEWSLNEMNDIMFPKYDVASKREAIGLYWEEYYNKIDKLMEEYPERFLLIRTEALSYENTQKAIFAFCGIAEQNWIFNKEHFNISE